jgi:hypothetical protein
MLIKRPPIELITLLYMLAYVPYIALTRWMSATVLLGFDRPLKGIEIVPANLIIQAVLLGLFFWLSGWWKDAHRLRVGRVSLPFPTRWTFLSGIGTAIILVTVPLSFTFKNVSIPFVQLLMRGDILVAAPLVDLLCRRNVRWYSWVALALTAAGIGVAVEARGNLNLPPLCWAVIGLYTAGYFGRLAVMTRIAKAGAPRELQSYYVEEQIAATPIALVLLAGLSAFDFGVPGEAMHLGFVGVWASSALLPLAAGSLILFVISLLAISILLDPRENTYCVPMERSASILAGIVAAYLLTGFFGQKAPTPAEMTGAAFLIAAITILSLAPRWRSRTAAAVESV